jgi:hypothetical protein
MLRNNQKAASRKNAAKVCTQDDHTFATGHRFKL